MYKNKYKTIFILIFFKCLQVCAENLIESENVVDTRKNSGFIFSMPATLVSGKNETVCISLHDAKIPAKALIDLKWKNRHFPTTKLLESGNSCFNLFVPNLSKKQPQLASIRVQVQINGAIQSAHNQDPILIYPSQENLIYIDTDLGVYKPGDNVKFRVLVLDDKLLPIKDNIAEIRIKNPLGITVGVWENVSLNSGLAQLEYQMVKESLLGFWKIIIGSVSKTFEVAKHATPRFKIDFHYPKLIYYKTKDVKIKICAFYSFGKPVNGMALLKVTDSHTKIDALPKFTELINGCADVYLTNDDLKLANLTSITSSNQLYDRKINLFFTVTVTERGTNKMHITHGKSLVYFLAYTMKFTGDEIFQTGLPYKGKIQIHNIQTDIVGDVVEICYNLALRKSWNYLNREQCSNFSIIDNSIDFTIYPLKPQVIHVLLKARSLNHTYVRDSTLLIRLFSPTNSYITIDEIKTKNECDNPSFLISYTTDDLQKNQNVTFYYMIKSHNHIHKLRKITHKVQKFTKINNESLEDNLENVIGEKSKYVKSVNGLDSFQLNVKLDKRIMFKYQILVYYVNKNGETIAATKNINTKPCKFKVNAKWRSNKVVPGDFATLNIETTSKSTCAVSAIDKSAHFLSASHQLLNLLNFIKSMPQERKGAPTNGKICLPPVRKGVGSLIDPNPNDWDLRRRKRYVHSFSEDFDTYSTFRKYGTIVISNFKLITKFCYDGPLVREHPEQVEYMLENNYEDENEGNTLPIRYEFPNTWIWDLVVVNSSSDLRRQTPHSITNWVTNVMCVSPTEGVTFSEETEISAFQSFFVEILTPYSIKRGENFYLPINVFNELDHNLPIRIDLVLSYGLTLNNPHEKMTASYCIQKKSTISHIFPIVANKIGIENITVVAEVDYQFPRYCGPETVVSKRDAVFKPILVEPEGFPVTKTQSALLCGSGTNESRKVSYQLEVPSNFVSGSDRAYLILNGDLLGPAIENIDDLLTIPDGCGEQIMASIAPNLYVMKYLKAINDLPKEIYQKILRNLKMGYQRILNYRHKDGSFSAFGYHDPAGSMFLTAFVLRTFKEAKQYIYVDQDILDRAVKWIFEHQLENGCFSTMYHVFQDMGGTTSENSTAGLTAYVILSLLEAEIEIPAEVQTNAKYCIRNQQNLDKFTLAIGSYALFKLKWYDEGTRLLDRLLLMANEHDNMLYFTNSDDDFESTAADLEITSYTLLSILQQNRKDNMGKAHSIARWLSSKTSLTGGFKSTQDTVVTLNALTNYALLINSKKLNVNVKIIADNQIFDVHITENERLKNRRFDLDNTNNNLYISVKGEGCILVQAVLNYHLHDISGNNAFKLNMELNPVSNVDQCSIASLSSCIAYNGPETLANMAVLEVNLPSGYQADRASLYELLKPEQQTKVKMFEEIKNQVILYFTKLDKQPICISFNINENNMVTNRQKSVIKLYDYYRPDLESLQFYNVNANCGSNDSLPEIGKDRKEEDQNNTIKIVKRQVNPGFVDLDIDMETPECKLGEPSYAKPENSTLNQTRARKTRSSKTANINPGFVDRDIEMETPTCKFVPVFARPDNKNSTRISGNRKIRSVKRKGDNKIRIRKRRNNI